MTNVVLMGTTVRQCLFPRSGAEASSSIPETPESLLRWFQEGWRQRFPPWQVKIGIEHVLRELELFAHLGGFGTSTSAPPKAGTGHKHTTTPKTSPLLCSVSVKL